MKKYESKKLLIFVASIIVSSLFHINGEVLLIEQQTTNVKEDKMESQEKGLKYEIISNGEERPRSQEEDTTVDEPAKQDNRRVDTRYSGKETIENEDGNVYASIDPIKVEPKLDIVSQGNVEVINGKFIEPISFQIYTNYSDFIEKYEIAIFREDDRDLVDPIKVISGEDIKFLEEITWNGDTKKSINIKPGDEFIYRLRVYDKNGVFDETNPRKIYALEKNVAKTVSKIDEKSVAEIKGGEIYGSENYAKQNIVMNSSKIRFHGVGLQNTKKLVIDGEEVPIDANGKFVYEKLYPVGYYDVLVEYVDRNDEEWEYTLKVDVPRNYFFGVGLLDLTMGENSVSGNREILSKDYHYDEEIYADGRLGFYSKSKFKGKFYLTAQFDTGESQIEDMFKGLSDRTNRDIFRQLDQDDHYLTYGDDSTTMVDVNTQGKGYIKLEWDKSEAVWGNYHTDFTDNESAQYNRSLYGAKGKYNSKSTTNFGESKVQLGGFASEPGTLFAHNEFAGTGGSLYYLNNKDIVSGSEKVWVEVKDRDSNRVIETIALQRGKDYEIDDYQGRILLSEPLPILVQNIGSSIIKDEPLNGDDVTLKVDYEYYTEEGFNGDDLVVGANAKVWLGNHVALGATYVNDDKGDVEYELAGTNAILRFSEGSYLEGEYATTKGVQADENFSSITGGLDFNESATKNNDAEGEILRIGAHVNFNDINENISYKNTFDAWYKNKDEGFSISRDERDYKEESYGAELNLEPGEKFRLNLRGNKYITDDEIDKTEDVKISALTTFDITEKLDVSAEVKYENYIKNDDKSTEEDATLIAGKLSYDVGKGTNVYGIVQTALDKSENYADNDLYTVGASTKLGDKLGIRLEGSTGDRGDSVTGGLDYSYGNNHDLYMNYTQSTNRTEKSRSITAGQRAKVNPKWNLFHESQFLNSNDDSSGIAHTFGTDYDVTEKLRLGFLTQYGTLTDREDQETERMAASTYLRYEGKDFTLRNKLEYRQDENYEDKKSKQWVTANTLEYVINDEITLLGKVNASISEDSDSDIADAKLIESGLGAAYRPINNDRLNLFGKYTYLYDLDTPTQGNPDEKSHNLSVEGTYDINRKWEAGAKYAYKSASLREERDEGEWYENSYDLLALRLRYHVIKNWDIFGEYHWLRDLESDDIKHGAIAEINYHVNDNIKIGVGYNFTDFNDELTDLDYDAKGWYLNLLGKY